MANTQKQTLTELKDIRAQLEVEVNETQAKLAEQTYSIELETQSNLNAILKQIDSSYEWSIKNAALVVNLYDVLKATKAEKNLAAKNNETVEGSYTVNLKSLDLNTLYSVLTNISGTGVEEARRFTKLLTNVGAQISDALNEMADANKEIQTKHVELAELDSTIANFGKEENVSADEIEISQ